MRDHTRMIGNSKDYQINHPPFELKDSSRTKWVVDQIVEKIDAGVGSIWNPISHFYNLYELAFGFHTNPNTKGHIVEFGSYRGASACVIGEAIKNSGAHDSPLFAVDPYPKIHSGAIDYAYVIARENYHRLELTNYICPVICPCLTFLKFWNLPIKLAYLDASHGYEETKQEIIAILPYIVPDGWFVCDDYATVDGGTQVMRVLDEFLNSQDEYTFDLFQDKAQAYIHVKSKQG